MSFNNLLKLKSLLHRNIAIQTQYEIKSCHCSAIRTTLKCDVENKCDNKALLLKLNNINNLRYHRFYKYDLSSMYSHKFYLKQLHILQRGQLIHKNGFHTNRPILKDKNSGNIPSYLQSNITPLDLEYLNLDEDEDLGEIVNDKEYEIEDFFNCRLVNYVDADSNFSVSCPSCTNSEENKNNTDLFVDKSSGFFVCPSCCIDGPWEKLMELINEKEESVSQEQLQQFFSTLTSLDDCHLHLLTQTQLKNVSINTLQDFGALINEDSTRLIIPVNNDESDVVGFHSISLIDAKVPVVVRYLTDESRSMLGPSNGPKMVVVPSISEVLNLTEYKVQAMTVPKKNYQNPFENVDFKEIVLWMDKTPAPSLLELVRSSKKIFSFVRPDPESPKMYDMTKTEIKEALNNATFTLSNLIKTFHDYREEIYYRLTHKEEVLGVQWKRYKELNDILLGHRRGELTVLTGPTGSGKTTFISEYSLDLCTEGVRTLWGSFEVTVPRLCEVLMQQQHGSPLPLQMNEFTEMADKFAELPLFFLSFHGQQSVGNVIKAMTEAVLVNGVEHIIIDNLQFMLGIAENAQETWLEQDRAVASFRSFASTQKCHVTVIAHPKKIEGDVLTMSSISGGARITQEADNVLLLQVTNPTSTNSKKVLQVAKNRYGGTLGAFPLRFHKESITMSSHFKKKKEKDDKEKNKKQQDDDDDDEDNNNNDDNDDNNNSLPKILSLHKKKENKPVKWLD